MAFVEHRTGTTLDRLNGNVKEMIDEMKNDANSGKLDLGAFMDSKKTVYKFNYGKVGSKHKYRIDCSDANEKIAEYEAAGRKTRFLQLQDNLEDTSQRQASKTYVNVLYPVVTLDEIWANNTPYSIYDLIDAIEKNLSSGVGQRIKI